MDNFQVKKLNRVEAKQALKRLNKHIDIHSKILKRYEEYLNADEDKTTKPTIKARRKSEAA